MNKKFLLSTMAACMLGTVPSFAAVEYWVSPNGDDANAGTEAEPYATPEMAILMANEGEETIIHFEKDAEFLIGKLEAGENKTIRLIGDNTLFLAEKDPLPQGTNRTAHRILDGGAGTNLYVEGIIFKNGRQIEYLGGGAIGFTGETLEVNNCQFIHNESGSGGNAICASAEEVIVRNSYFEDNYSIGYAARGGAQLGVGQSQPQYGRIAVALAAQLLQARPPRGLFLCMLPTHGQGRGLRINSPHGAGITLNFHCLWIRQDAARHNQI